MSHQTYSRAEVDELIVQAEARGKRQAEAEAAAEVEELIAQAEARGKRQAKAKAAAEVEELIARAEARGKRQAEAEAATQIQTNQVEATHTFTKASINYNLNRNVFNKILLF